MVVGARVRAASLVLLALFCGAAATQAQERIVRPRRLLLFFAEAKGARYSDSERRLLSESLLARLASPEAPFRILEWEGADPPRDDADRTEAALASDCDAWASVELLGSVEKPGYRLRSFDLVTRKQMADLAVVREAPLRPRDLERRFWDEAAVSLAESFKAVELGTRVRFRGAAGTRITGLPGGPLVLGPDGEAEVVLVNPSLYSIRATHALYDPVRLVFSVKDDPLAVELPQVRAARYLLDLGLTTFNFFAADAGVYLLPNYVFVKVGFTSYLLGFSLAMGEKGSLLVEEPLVDLRFQVGRYLSEPDAPIRWYGTAGLVLRFVASGDMVGLEPIAPVALQAGVGAETSPWRRAGLFLEVVPTLYLARDEELLASSYPEDYDMFQAARVGVGLLDFVHFRAGVRMRL